MFPNENRQRLGEKSRQELARGLDSAIMYKVMTTNGTYQLNTSIRNGVWYCNVYRNGKLLTMVRESSLAKAVKEARRNVRNARKSNWR